LFARWEFLLTREEVIIGDVEPHLPEHNWAFVCILWQLGTGSIEIMNNALRGKRTVVIGEIEVFHWIVE
jgi:hypothetical protein